jgi:hypothetical protein
VMMMCCNDDVPGIERFIQHNYADGSYKCFAYNSSRLVGAGRHDVCCHTCTHTNIHVQTTTHTHTHKHIHTHTHTRIHTHAHIHIHTQTHTRTNNQTHTRTHIHIHTYTHTHTHTHTNILHRWTMADRMYSEYEETLGRKWVPSGYSRPTTGSEVHRYSVFTTGLFCSLAGLFCRKIGLF